jgi:hypothetical protein
MVYYYFEDLVKKSHILLLSWNMDSCVAAHPAVYEWGGMKLGQSSAYYPRIWIAHSPPSGEWVERTTQL